MEITDNSEGIVTPHENDVLCGRGRFEHAGNLYLIALVGKLKPAYANCSERSEKRKQLVQLVFEEIRGRSGRFLKQDNETKLWHDIGDKLSLYKVRQSLREGAPELLRQGVTCPSRYKGEGGERGKEVDTEGGHSSEEDNGVKRYGVSKALDHVTSRQVIEFLQEASQVLEAGSVVSMISILNRIKKGGITLNGLKELVRLLDGNKDLIERLDSFLQDELEFMSGKRGHKVIITTASAEAATMIQLWASPPILDSVVEVSNSARKKRKRHDVTVEYLLSKESMQIEREWRTLAVAGGSVGTDGETKVEGEEDNDDDSRKAETQNEGSKK